MHQNLMPNHKMKNVIKATTKQIDSDLINISERREQDILGLYSKNFCGIDQQNFTLDKNKCPVDSSSNKFSFLGFSMKKSNQQEKQQRKKFVEDSHQEQLSYSESSKGVSFLTKKAYALNHSQFTDNNTQKNDSFHQLGIQSGKQNRVQTIICNKLGIQSNSQEENSELLCNSNGVIKNINEKQKKTNLNLSAVTPAHHLKIQIQIDHSQLIVCRLCSYQVKKSEILPQDLCRICFLVENTRLISFRGQQNFEENLKRIRSTTINPRQRLLIERNKDIEDRLISRQKYQHFKSRDHNLPRSISISRLSLQNIANKCENPTCQKIRGTLIKFKDKKYCIKCYYEKR